MSSHVTGVDLYGLPPATADANEFPVSQTLQPPAGDATAQQTFGLHSNTVTVPTTTVPGMTTAPVHHNSTIPSGVASSSDGVANLASRLLTTTTTTASTGTTSSGRPTVVVPKVEIKLFVGRLPKLMSESELEPLFGQYGTVLETVIIRDKASGQHKGSAFIKMASLTDADKAIRALHNLKVVDNQLGPIQVKYANGETERLGLPVENANPGIDVGKLFVGSLLRGVSEQQVRDIFEPFGLIEEIVLMKDPGSGQTKGCAFVKYALKENAIYAMKTLNGVHHCPGCPRALEVKFAESRRTGTGTVPGGPSHGVPGGGLHPSVYGLSGMAGLGVSHRRAPAPVAAPPSNLNPRSAAGWTEYFTADGRPYYHNELTKTTQWTKPAEFDRILPPTPSAPPPSGGSSTDSAGPPGANVFVFHIPNEWTQSEINLNFSPFGRVVSSYIATDPSTGRNKGYGFVSFDTVDAAANAVLGMNGFLVGSKRLKVSIKNGEESYVAHLLSPQAQAAAIQAGQMGTTPAALGGAGGMVGYGMVQSMGGVAGGGHRGAGGQAMMMSSLSTLSTNPYYGAPATAGATPQQTVTGVAGYGPAATTGAYGAYRATPY